MLSGELSRGSDGDLIGITACEREDEASDVSWCKVIEDLSKLGFRLSDS